MRQLMAEIEHTIPKAVPEATRAMPMTGWQCPCRITVLTAQRAFKQATDNHECTNEEWNAVRAVLAGVLPKSRGAEAGTEEERIDTERRLGDAIIRAQHKAMDTMAGRWHDMTEARETAETELAHDKQIHEAVTQVETMQRTWQRLKHGI